MPPLSSSLRAWGGIATLRELNASPAQQRRLARAVDRGELLRPRKGVYALPDAHPDLVRAARVGGRLTGVSALPHRRLWTPPCVRREPLHVEVHIAMTPIRQPGDPRIHWSRERVRPQFGLAPLEDVLRLAAADLPLPFAVAVMDSAMRVSPLTPVELLMAAQSWRGPARRAAELSDERSESGTESVLRVLLDEAGIPSTPQVPLPTGDLDRADLLVGDRLIIECDSEAHHAEPAHRRADLRRDELLVARGYLVLRLDYRQVFDDPAGVVAVVEAIVARREHLSARPARGG